ncbi:diacylglycerol kinase [Allorhizobium sp. BGMRC 0089]|uniref:diacylglycerol kinase n=1 Tax=Allorhizobium sonneratiae TaxID=2934936 RepID=UPI0020342530|nr:diacylglycerol kinase [Allorhizobium sonneratiae]MCM2292942.1 diacylglycerol kinase [Allorhizobium sonneratiae]
MDRHSQKTTPLFTKKTGFAHLYAATLYSFQGFKRLCQESAFRHELLLFLASLGLFAGMGVALPYYLGIVVLMLVLFATEALNTAIEEVIDRISPEFSVVARNAKDLGSFAVFCLLLANGAYVLWVVMTTLEWT